MELRARKIYEQMFADRDLQKFGQRRTLVQPLRAADSLFAVLLDDLQVVGLGVSVYCLTLASEPIASKLALA